MAGRSFRPSDSQSGRNTGPPTVTFSRRTSSGRYVNLSRDSLDSEMSGVEFSEYTVQIPPTPDNQPMDTMRMDAPPMSQRVEEQYVSSSLFTGGFNSVTRAHLMDKVIESETNHPQMPRGKRVFLCDTRLRRKRHERRKGRRPSPLRMRFQDLCDCFLDAVKTGEGICQGCKEPYKNTELPSDSVDNGQPLPFPSSGTMSKMERRLSLMKSTNRSAVMRSQSGLMGSQTGVDFDHNRWLFETKGTYGYGNAIWPKDGGFADDKSEESSSERMELLNKPWRPLTRKLKIPEAIISAYRLLIFIRMVVLGLFLAWRINHPNEDARWLWMMSIVCELWFAFSWLLDQLPKLCPVFHIYIFHWQILVRDGRIRPSSLFYIRGSNDPRIDLRGSFDPFQVFIIYMCYFYQILVFE